MIQETIDRFYKYSRENVERELLEFFGWPEEQFNFEMERRDMECIKGEERDMRWESLLFFYEGEVVNTGRWMLAEVWNKRKPLKTLMTMRSIRRRMGKLNLEVVDYGAGSGCVGLPLAMGGAYVDLYEFGANAKVLEDRKVGLKLQNVKIKHPYLEPLMWDGDKDIIVCYETLEHVFDPLTYIVIFNRALKVGGLLYLTYSFGPGSFMHLEENQIYHEVFQYVVTKYGFSKELERMDLETTFPVHIFKKECRI